MNPTCQACQDACLQGTALSHSQEQHLATCAECQEVAKVLRLLATPPAAAGSPPLRLERRILAHAAKRQASTREWWSWQLARRWVPLAAAATLALVGILWLTQPSPTMPGVVPGPTVVQAPSPARAEAPAHLAWDATEFDQSLVVLEAELSLTTDHQELVSLVEGSF